MARIILICLVFMAGIAATESFNRYSHHLDVIECGQFKPGWTTIIAYDDGDLICVYRQQDWPQKTISGRNV